MQTKLIIFSKNRALQCKSLLLSLRELTDVEERDVSVLYVSDPRFPYDHLKETFVCDFVEQNHFLQDLRRIVSEWDGDYVGFMVDDLICRRPFRFADIEAFMARRHDVDGFCLRMGSHIQCPPAPEFKREGDVLIWDTSSRLGRYWNYFWELCCSIYRKDLVEEYLKKCRPDRETYPNPFEWHYYVCMPSTNNLSALTAAVNAIRFAFKKKSHRIACFDTSVCLTQGVNMVADRPANFAECFSPEELHKKMEEGYVVDYHSLRDIDLKVPQAGDAHFKLIHPDELK